MAGIFSLRNWVMKQLMKNDKSGIMKLPPKGKIDFGEMLLREQLFKKGINPGMIKNEKQLDNILDTPAVSKSQRAKPKKSGKVIEVDFDKGRWNKAQGGRPGLSYLLAEDTNERMPLAGGGSGKPPINFYVDFSGSGGGKQENFLNVPGLNESGYNYGGTFGADTTFPFLGGDLSVGGEFGIGRNKSNVDYKGQPIDFLSNVGEKKLGDDWNVGFKWRKKFAGGGMGRRAFLKLMAALGLTGVGAKYGLASLLKGGAKKEVAEEVVKSAGVSGNPPPYFFKLVDKIKTLGDETLASQDKTIAKKYKDYVMEEDFSGNITIIKKNMDDPYPTEVIMSYKVDEVALPGKKGSAKVDEYEEFTVRPDGDGKMKDIEPGVPDEVVEEGTMFEDNMTEFGKK
jgi:hypothetical protein